MIHSMKTARRRLGEGRRGFNLNTNGTLSHLQSVLIMIMMWLVVCINLDVRARPVRCMPVKGAHEGGGLELIVWSILFIFMIDC